MDLYVRFKMVHVVIELVWDTIEDEAEQTKPEDSDEELLRGPWFSEHLNLGDDTCGFQHHESSSSELFNHYIVSKFAPVLKNLSNFLVTNHSNISSTY